MAVRTSRPPSMRSESREATGAPGVTAAAVGTAELRRRESTERRQRERVEDAETKMPPAGGLRSREGDTSHHDRVTVEPAPPLGTA